MAWNLWSLSGGMQSDANDGPFLFIWNWIPRNFKKFILKISQACDQGANLTALVFCNFNNVCLWSSYINFVLVLWKRYLPTRSSPFLFSLFSFFFLSQLLIVLFWGVVSLFSFLCFSSFYGGHFSLFFNLFFSFLFLACKKASLRLARKEYSKALYMRKDGKKKKKQKNE